MLEEGRGPRAPRLQADASDGIGLADQMRPESEAPPPEKIVRSLGNTFDINVTFSNDEDVRHSSQSPLSFLQWA